MRSRALRYRLYRNATMSCFPDGRSAPPTISYATPQSWTEATAISTLSPTTTGATSFAVTTGALPTGLSINAGTGAITGTPTVPGTGSFKVTATGAGGATESGAVSWTVAYFLNQFSPTVYFDAGYSTMWQDSARTTAATADADPIGSWDDLSGNGNHAKQSTAGARPTRKHSILNSLTVARGDGVDDWLESPGVPPASMSVFIVAIPRTVTGAIDGLFTTAATNTPQDPGPRLLVSRTTTSLDAYAPTSGYSALGTVASGTPFLCAVIQNATDRIGRFNGAQAFSGAIGAGGSADVMDLFTSYDNQGQFDIALCVVFPSIISGADLTAIEAYINARWAAY